MRKDNEYIYNTKYKINFIYYRIDFIYFFRIIYAEYDN